VLEGQRVGLAAPSLFKVGRAPASERPAAPQHFEVDLRRTATAVLRTFKVATVLALIAQVATVLSLVGLQRAPGQVVASRFKQASVAPRGPRASSTSLLELGVPRAEREARRRSLGARARALGQREERSLCVEGPPLMGLAVLRAFKVATALGRTEPAAL
jgi:hypothetical protein